MSENCKHEGKITGPRCLSCKTEWREIMDARDRAHAEDLRACEDNRTTWQELAEKIQKDNTSLRAALVEKDKALKRIPCSCTDSVGVSCAHYSDNEACAESIAAKALALTPEAAVKCQCKPCRENRPQWCEAAGKLDEPLEKLLRQFMKDCADFEWETGLRRKFYGLRDNIKKLFRQGLDVGKGPGKDGGV